MICNLVSFFLYCFSFEIYQKDDNSPPFLSICNYRYLGGVFGMIKIINYFIFFLYQFFEYAPERLI